MHINDKEAKLILFKKKLSELVFDDDKFIDAWMNRPNMAFNDKTPMDLVNENNFDPLFAMIYRLGSGEPSS